MNPRVAEISPSIIRALNDRKKEGAIDLGMGQPVLKPALYPLVRAVSWVEEHGCPYSPNAGFLELRTAIARHYQYPYLSEPGTVCVTVGSQEALYLAVQGLLDPATDEVLVVTPAFPAYQKLCHMLGVPVREVALDPETGFAADADRVLAAIGPRTRLIALASPNNPTGRVWPESELRRLTEGLAARPEPVYLLSDEVYSELYFGPDRPASPASFYPHTLVASSLSKSCALTGLRLGWLMAPIEISPTLFKAHQFAVSCADTVAQRAAIEIFKTPELLTAHRAHYQAQHAAAVEALTREALSFVSPEGAFYCMLRLPEPWAKDTMDTALKLMDRHNVVAIPGSVFGAAGFLRLSIVAAPELLREGIGRIAAFLRGVA
jgi:aspartate/methionine/tyrosine aminotransferase